jgi:hypothetical protein
MTEGTRGRSFDALAKGLASGDVSRGKALKLMGAALLGGLLASIPTVAGAKPKANKCIKDKQCPAGTTCVSGVCVNAPNVLYCSCQDGTQLDTCTSLDCGSDFVPGSGSDQVCASLCGARHGGGSTNFCIANNYPQCGAVPPPPPGPGPNNVDCHCQAGGMPPAFFLPLCTQVRGRVVLRSPYTGSCISLTPDAARIQRSRDRPPWPSQDVTVLYRNTNS